VEVLLCRCAGYWSATGSRQLLLTYLMQCFFSTKFAVFGPKICEIFGEFIFLLLIRLIFLSTGGDALSKSLGSSKQCPCAFVAHDSSTDQIQIINK
jgi:hypothetical protein